MNKKIYGIIILSVIVSGVVFYGGMVYADMSRGNSGGNPANFSAGEGNRFPADGGSLGTRSAGGEFSASEIISKDDTSVTVKMQNGSTKIVLIGSDTQIMTWTAGSSDDLTIGTKVMVTGSTNSDGSISAQSIQVGVMSLNSRTFEPNER